MSYKDVAVFLDPGEACDARIDYVVAAALRWRASVIGLDITAPEAYDDAISQVVERALLVRERFEDALVRVRLDGEYRLADPAPERVVWQARCADLVVAGPP